MYNPELTPEKKESIETATLERPSIQLKKSYLEAIAEFHNERRYIDVHIDVLENDFDTYLDTFAKEALQENTTPDKVPQTTYWLTNNGEYIGRLSIRHELNDHLLKIGGHIGYDVRPSKRRMGYGTKQLELGLEKARELGLGRALLTCDKDNIGSRKIIESHGGVLENEVPGEVPKLRFWIDL